MQIDLDDYEENAKKDFAATPPNVAVWQALPQSEIVRC